MTQQRRQFPRYAIELDAVIVTSEEEVPGRTHDLSRGGFCMMAPKAIAVGEVVRVRLSLVFSENQFSEHLELPATVVWCTPMRATQQLGIKFGPIDPTNRGYLDVFIKLLDDSAGEEDGET
ncbi:MAG TPA: PilZ domain-containing protein [Polyangia bacterium]|nr:PilZ domain-containing protein [Polyangia bacterium]